MREKYDITLASGMKGAKLKNVAKKNMNRDGSWFYLSMAGQIGYTVAIPLVIGTVVGSYFKHALIGLVLGILISIAGFVRILKNLL